MTRRAERGLEPSWRSGQQGFTLIEMMVALLIFGLLAAAGASLLSFAVRAQGVSGKKLDDIAAIERLDAALTADLAQALPRPTRDQGGTPRPAFESGDGFPLFRLVRGGWENVDNSPRAGLQKVEYRLANGVIQRVAWPMLDGAEALPPVEMMKGVASVKLRYRRAGAWSDAWTPKSARAMPDAVELTIARTDGTVLREMLLVGAGEAGGDDAG